MNAAILLAAGLGSRMGNAGGDKILALVASRPVIGYSLEASLGSGVIDLAILVYRDDEQRQRLDEVVRHTQAPTGWINWVRGGAERQESVRRALESLPEEVVRVFVHDTARPLIQPDTFRQLNELVHTDGAACAARRLTDTIKEAPDEGTPRAARLRTLDRSRLWRLETPQAFEKNRIRAAYREAERRGIHLTDDAAALELTGEPVTLLELTYPNPKLTTTGDLAYIEFLLQQK